ncbi:MAG: PAS domain S-box protein [Desulfobacterales bacterium]|nr:PAS domain S-box protein [Desulfobacterales bacterium]
MAQKPAYEELEKKIKLLESKISFKQARESIKQSLKKHDIPVYETKETEMAVDVIGQKDAEKQPVEQVLITEHIFRRSIEESIPSGIAGIDLNGYQIYVNNAFCDMLGWSEEELIGKNYPFVYFPSKATDTDALKFELILKGQVPPEGIELIFERKNGLQFYGLVTSSDLTDNKGETIGYLISVADITLQKDAEKALRELSSRLINAQESERKHISQNLHDSIGGKLAGIKYSLEKILSEYGKTSEQLRNSIENVINITINTIEETQRIYKNLHPAILDDLGLCPALRNLCSEFMGVYFHLSIHARFEISGDSSIPESMKILIYRITQEALNNIAKHSKADKAEVILAQNGNMTELTISDNGSGFDLDDVLQNQTDQHRSIGLKSIKERTMLFGGSLEIKSTPGKGTTIQATWDM